MSRDPKQGGAKKKKEFTGLWIPKDLWFDNELTMQEKLFYSRIKLLDNEQGCYAGNKYFAEFFGMSKRRCIDIIKSLVAKKRISSKLIYRKGTISVEKRQLKVIRFYGEDALKNAKKGGEENFTTPSEESCMRVVKNPAQGGEESFTRGGEESCTVSNRSTSNRISNRIESNSAREEKTESEEVFEKAKLTAEKVIEKEKDSAQKEKDFPVDDSHLTGLNEKTKWTVVAQNMAAFFEGPGKDQWDMMCTAAGGWVQPLAITTMWAGKNQDSDYILKNWSNHTGKLTNWIKNELRSNRTHQAKIKSLNNGRNGSTASKELLSDETLEQAYRELIAEGYK